MRRQVLSLLIITILCLIIPYIIAPAHASEPTLTEILDHLGFTSIAETDYEKFPPGLYEITLYAEFANFSDKNILSYYEVGTSTHNLVFAGPEGGFGYISPPVTKTILIDYKFGFSMLTSDGHRYFTENSLNPDGYQHSKVYRNLNEPHMFLIGFENLYGVEGDRDYQDMVFSLKLYTPPNTIPEVPLGTIVSSLSMLIAFIGFVGFKRFRSQPKQPKL